MKTIFSLVWERKLQKLLFGLIRLNGSTRPEFVSSDMRNLPKSTFRKKMRNKLFEILSESDDYLEINEIMHQRKFN